MSSSRPAILLATILIAGCGGSSGASDARQVRSTLAELTRATARKDYATLCSRVLAPALVQRVAAQIGLPCDVALARGLGGVTNPQLVVRAVKITGATALASVHTAAAGQAPFDTTVALTKQNGHWYVASLAGAAAPTP